MLFNSLSFLLLFLPLSWVVFYALARFDHRYAGGWLVAVSFVFYSWWDASLAVLLAASIAFNYFCGTRLLRAAESDRERFWWSLIGIGGDLLLLFYYKYFFAILEWLGLHGIVLFSDLHPVALPLGISFFTFTQIGYLMDCKDGIVKENRFLDYGLFVTFFPHLIAGPILHHREMMPQYRNPESYRFQSRNFAAGAALFIMGLAKKAVLADFFIPTVKATFAQPQHLALLPAWNGVLSYSLQLYFDFSGYSDMACGLALLFGMRFPANFNSPYRAACIIDFWQRWHMSLTRYLTLLLYNPIALWVTRRRVAMGKSVSRKAQASVGGFLSMIALPLFYTMILAGIWHGAGMTFLVFGLLHACYLTINHAWRGFGPKPKPGADSFWRQRLILVGQIALTYLAVLVAQIFFRAESCADAGKLLLGMLGTHGISGPLQSGPLYVHVPMLVGLFAVVWTMPNTLELLEQFRPSLSDIRRSSLISIALRPTVAWGMALGALAALAVFSVTGTTEFLYFRF